MPNPASSSRYSEDESSALEKEIELLKKKLALLKEIHNWNKEVVIQPVRYSPCYYWGKYWDCSQGGNP